MGKKSRTAELIILIVAIIAVLIAVLVATKECSNGNPLGCIFLSGD